MNIPEPTRYIAKQLCLPNTPLKEVEPSRKKQLNTWSDKHHTLIIDYGSQNIKAGYQGSSGPQLVFRPQISKNRDLSKFDLPIKAYVNTSYDQLDFLKNNYKSPYERNIILHFSLIEQCNDYIFAQLAKNNKKIRSPLMITEPLGNPIHCRSSFLEQIFECYEIDSILVGIEALFAYFYELDCSISRYDSETALVVDVGASTIHIVPVVNGKFQSQFVHRINLGGNNAFDMFSRSILLKNPHFKDKLNYRFMRQIYQQFTSVAIDYRLQLKYFQSRFKAAPNSTIYRNRIQAENAQYTQQLSFIPGIQIDFDLITEIPEEQIRRKQEVRKRMSQKLKDTLNRRKESKQKAYETELQNLLELKQRYQSHDKFAHEEVVQIFGEHRPLDKLEKKVKALQIKLGLVEEKGEENKFNLISIPDHQLPPQKLKYKKLQIYQKQALEARKQKQIEKEQSEAKMRDLRENNPQLYLHQLKESYKGLSARIIQNQRIKTQLNNRKSKLKQRKMMAIARMAEQQFDSEMEQGEDDWLVFKDLQESDHGSQLEAMEVELRDIDPEWTQAKDQHHLKQNNQLFIQTDLIRCHEIYFQPLMVGVNQLNLTKSIAKAISSFSSPTAEHLRKNIIIVGGGSQIPGFKERLHRDLTSESPSGSVIRVSVGKGGINGAFMGMQYIAKYQKELLDRFSFKREEYLSKSGNYFVDNPWSNPAPKV